MDDSSIHAALQPVAAEIISMNQGPPAKVQIIWLYRCLCLCLYELVEAGGN